MWKLLISLILGLPIYRGGFPRFNSLDNLLNPRPSLPRSAITRDPFWYDLGDVGLRPFWATSDLPPCLRESYLSPVKRRYLWTKHPLRPFGKFSWCHLKTANTLEMFNSSLSLSFSNAFQQIIICSEDEIYIPWSVKCAYLCHLICFLNFYYFELLWLWLWLWSLYQDTLTSLICFLSLYSNQSVKGKICKYFASFFTIFRLPIIGILLLHFTNKLRWFFSKDHKIKHGVKNHIHNNASYYFYKVKRILRNKFRKSVSRFVQTYGICGIIFRNTLQFDKNNYVVLLFFRTIHISSIHSEKKTIFPFIQSQSRL